MASLLLLLAAGGLLIPGRAPVPRVWAPAQELAVAPALPDVEASAVASVILTTGTDLQALSMAIGSDFTTEDSILATAQVACTGTEGVGTVLVGFYEGHPDSGGVPIGVCSGGPLAPGEVVPVSVRWSGRAGETLVWCLVDPDDAIAEANEEDNAACARVCLVTGVPFLWQEMDGFCHYASQGMLFNSLGYAHTIHEMVETNLVPYSPIYYQGQFTGSPGIFTCQTTSDMEWNGSIRQASCSLEVLAGWSSYLARLEELVDSGVPAETSVDPYYLPQPDYDFLREHDIHSGHGVVVVGYSDSSVVMNDPGVGLELLGEEPLPNPELRGKNVAVPRDVFRLAVENSLGTSYLLLSYESTGPLVTQELLLCASLEKGLRRLAGDVASYDDELVEYLQPASPTFGRDAIASLAQDMNPAAFNAWYQYILAYYGGNLNAALEVIEGYYSYLVGLSSVGLIGPEEFYGTVSYPYGATLSALSDTCIARCDTACAVFTRMIDVIRTSGGSTAGVIGHLDSLRTISLDWLALEDSVSATGTSLWEWLSQNASIPVAATPRLEATVWPCPCAQLAWLRWDQPSAGRAQASLYDVKGNLVSTVFDRSIPAGTHHVAWHPGDAAQPGVYFLRLTCPGETEGAMRIVLTR